MTYQGEGSPMREAWRTAALGFGAGLVGAAVGVAGLGAGPGVPDEVRARRVAVEDDKGRERIALETREDGRPEVTLYDAKGRARLFLMLAAAGAPALSLNDADRHSRLNLGLGDHGSPVVQLYDGYRSQGVRLMVHDEAGASVRVQNRADDRSRTLP